MNKNKCRLLETPSTQKLIKQLKKIHGKKNNENIINSQKFESKNLFTVPSKESLRTKIYLTNRGFENKIENRKLPIIKNNRDTLKIGNSKRKSKSDTDLEKSKFLIIRKYNPERKIRNKSKSEGETLKFPYL